MPHESRWAGSDCSFPAETEPANAGLLNDGAVTAGWFICSTHETDREIHHPMSSYKMVDNPGSLYMSHRDQQELEGAGKAADLQRRPVKGFPTQETELPLLLSLASLSSFLFSVRSFSFSFSLSYVFHLLSSSSSSSSKKRAPSDPPVVSRPPAPHRVHAGPQLVRSS